MLTKHIKLLCTVFRINVLRIKIKLRHNLSCRNPGDASGAADIDVIVATGRTVWLLDAKHYAPARDGIRSIDHVNVVFQEKSFV